MRPALLHYLTAVQRGDSSYDSHLTEEMESGEQSREVTHPCPRATKWLCLGGEAGFSDRLSLPHHLVSLTSGLLGHQLFQQVSPLLFEWVQSCLHLASHPPPPCSLHVGVGVEFHLQGGAQCLGCKSSVMFGCMYIWRYPPVIVE